MEEKGYIVFLDQRCDSKFFICRPKLAPGNAKIDPFLTRAIKFIRRELGMFIIHDTVI